MFLILKVMLSSRRQGDYAGVKEKHSHVSGPHHIQGLGPWRAQGAAMEAGGLSHLLAIHGGHKWAKVVGQCHWLLYYG